MTLGKRQRETLDDWAERLKRQPHIIRIEVRILPFRYFTREMGGGRGYPISIKPFECYEEGHYEMRGEWVSRCEFDYTAIEKGQEIARYLVAAGCPKDRIRLRRM